MFYIFNQAANPTSPERQRMILESLSLVPDSLLAADRSDEPDLDSVIDALGNATIAPKHPSCSCTRKCATVSCPCNKSLKLCDQNCHPKNLKCLNI